MVEPLSPLIDAAMKTPLKLEPPIINSMHADVIESPTMSSSSGKYSRIRRRLALGDNQEETPKQVEFLDSINIASFYNVECP